jgi:hypothetical protein
LISAPEFRSLNTRVTVTEKPDDPDDGVQSPSSGFSCTAGEVMS